MRRLKQERNDMKDIDFDELDRAVNSLMGSVDAPKPVSPEPTKGATEPVIPAASSQESIVAVSVTSPATVNPTVSPVAPVSSPVGQPVTSIPAKQEPSMPSTSTPSLVPARKNGRFMDMVSAPTDRVRPATPTAPSRDGLTITPRPQTEESQVEPAPVETDPPAEPEEVIASSTDMPDPLSMVEDEASEPEVIDTPAPAPAESPFITDAKVEKRPLNAGALTTSEASVEQPTEVPLEQPLDEPGADHYDTQRGADEPPELPQTPELDKDLVAIESNEPSEVVAMSAPDAEVEAAPEPEDKSVPLGAASIAQQYKTQPSTGDQSHAAIYDATEYPDPMSHPAKQKSGWLWVVWVILLLGVGVGGAVVLYTLNIIP